ncbi:uncharacterized protein LOC142994866 isoform X1 [Genypterus blacodes]|uniref:uncharacterized protein LOC142994866 isoform X1 n=1 Tax=Genypterus blacodes TaxID=154954 RepID=UPI003F7653DC
MDASDPATMIAKRVSQLNKEASLITLAAQNLQRKRKLSEILGQIGRVVCWAARQRAAPSSPCRTSPATVNAPLQGRQYLLLGEELLLLWTMLTESMLSLLTAGPDWTLQFLPNVLCPSLRPRSLFIYLYESEP